MRRKDREMSREFALAVMDKCEWTVVSFVTPEGEPYAVPVSAVREGDVLFFHTAKEGRKIDCIAHSPAVHVVCVGDVERAKDKFTTGYECAMADGVCREVTDDAEKLHALRLIAEKYTPEHPSRRNTPRSTCRRLKAKWRQASPARACTPSTLRASRARRSN